MIKRTVEGGGIKITGDSVTEVVQALKRDFKRDILPKDVKRNPYEGTVFYLLKT